MALLITPFLRITGTEPDSGPRLVGLLGGTLDWFTAYLLLSLLKRLTDNPWGQLIGVTSYIFSPWVIAMSISNLEIPLVHLTTAGLLLGLLKLVGDEENVSVRQWLMLGLVVGLTVLARTDSILIIAPVGFSVVIPYWRRLITSSSLPKSWPISGWSLALVVAGLLIAPWLIWNYQTFGTPVQSSGLAFPTLKWAGLLAEWGGFDLFRAIRWSVGTIVHDLIYWQNYSGLSFMSLPALGFLTGVFLVGQKDEPWLVLRRGSIFLIPFVTGLGIHLLVDGGLRLATQHWHFSRVSIATSVLWGLIAVYVLNTVSRSHTKVVATLILFLTTLTLSGWTLLRFIQQRTEFVHQISARRVTLWSNEHLDPYAVRASFGDSGIVGYYSPGPVVNLDGKLDFGALVAVQRRSLYDYLIHRRVKYLIDSTETPAGLEPILGTSEPSPFTLLYAENGVGVFEVR